MDVSYTATSGFGGGNVCSILPVANNKIIVCGSFTSYNGVSIYNIALVNDIGTLDPTLNLGYASYNRVICNIQQNLDGSFICSGNFDNSTTFGNNSVEKLTSSYTIDYTFNAVSGVAGGEIKAFATQSDEKIVIGGNFFGYNKVRRIRIVLITADGEIDSSFNPGLGTNGYVNSIVVQPDGKIVATGDFTS